MLWGRGLLLDIELACPLDNVVAGPLDMHGRVVGRSVLLDGVAALRFDGYFAVVFGFGYLAAWCAAALVP
jgi:hypothetical protein